MNASRKIRTIAALGTLSGAVWAGTFASFSDTGAGVATFTNGTVDLQVGDAVNDADYAFTQLTMTNAKPGDVDYGEVLISNDGSLPFTYGMTVTTTDGTPAGLGARLLVEVKNMPLAATSCTAELFATTGTPVLASTSLSGASFSGQSLAAANNLDATDEANLCFKVTFPNGTEAADNPLQGASTSARLTFTAAQV